MAIISLLAALLIPAAGRAKEAAKATSCLSNLRQAGIAIQLYVQENNNRMPFIQDQYPGVTNNYPGPEKVLSSQLGNTNVLRCVSDSWPADHAKPLADAGGTYFHQTGSSYSWNFLVNGQNADHLRVIGLDLGSHQTPLLFDKEKFHLARGEAKAQNFLYADGHIKNLLAIEGSIQKK